MNYDYTYSTIIYRRTGTRSDFITPVLQEQPSKANQMLKKPSQEWKLRVFLMKLAKNITVDELNEIKLLLKAEYHTSKTVLSEIKTVIQVFDHLMDIAFMDVYNLQQLQSLVWHLDRKDLHTTLTGFAREYNTCPLQIFKPDRSPRNGYVYADFHVGGQLETTSKLDIETMRTTIADRLFVPSKFIYIKGIEYLHSLTVTLMIPESSVFSLFELSDVEKSALKNLKIDSFEIEDKHVKLAEEPLSSKPHEEILAVGKVKKRRRQYEESGYQNSHVTTDLPDVRFQDPSEEISVQRAIQHGDVRLLRALAASNTDLTDGGRFYPLHTAASLGMKRLTSYLLQSGFDIDELNQYGRTPLESVDQSKDKVLLQYMRKVGGITSATEHGTHDGNEAGIGSSTPQPYVCVNMERVDLSFRTVYLPSSQFRATFKTTLMGRDSMSKFLFVSPCVSEYKTLCTYQMYGLLNILGQCESGGDVKRCLECVVLPNRQMMTCKDRTSGVFNFDTFSDCRVHGLNGNIDGMPSWICSILNRTTYSPCSLLCDGWTPMHYAILTRNDDLLNHLCDTGEGNLKEKTHTLLPKFILDQLKDNCLFEYEYVYSHIEGFTPLTLATYTGNQSAITSILQNIETVTALSSHDIADALLLAYCDEVEPTILRALCNAGKKQISHNHQVEVNLKPYYRKENPLRRILSGSSRKVLEEIEEEICSVPILVENKNIIVGEYENTSTLDAVSEEEDNLLAETIEFHSDRLWKRHSILNAITPGHISSLQTKCQGYNKTTMIVLHSTYKHLNPSSEIPFPGYLTTNGSRILVHVVEGSFRFGNTVKVGQSIDSEEYRATTGVFVQNTQNKIGFLTCAHTFLREFFDSKEIFHDELFDPDKSPQLLKVFTEAETNFHVFKTDNSKENDGLHSVPTSLSVDVEEMEAIESMQVCGYVRRLVLRPKKDIGIDVALILFNDDATVTLSPQLHLEHSMSRQQLRGHLVKNKKHLTFTNGEIFKGKRSVTVCKCGIGTGFSVGKISFDKSTCQFKISDDSTENEPLAFSDGKNKAHYERTDLWFGTCSSYGTFLFRRGFGLSRVSVRK
ncbi:uncharacterized protein [Argopecten irradians]|uniref:uncharacterized protein isoform X2 n=1 Tax=Argopecten irradians TaxID=31199 RepID=UPI00371398BA